MNDGGLADLMKRQLSVLDELKEQVDTFFEISVDLLAIANADGYFIKLSRSWERATGYSIEELTSKPFSEFIVEEDRSKTAKELGDIIFRNGGGLGTMDFTNRYRHANGSTVVLQWRSSEKHGLVYGVARVIDTSTESES